MYRRILVPGLISAVWLGLAFLSQTDPVGSSFAADRDVKDAKASASGSGKSEKDEGGFKFPEDRGGKLLSGLLSPTVGNGDEKSVKKTTSAPRALEEPELPLPPTVAMLPRLPQDFPERKLRPGSIPEELPFGTSKIVPKAPQEPVLPAGERINRPHPDPNLPVPLPYLTPKPLSDRAAFDDPTVDVSIQLSTAAPMQQRTDSAPALRFPLPDPFEYRTNAQLKETPVETVEFGPWNYRK